MERPFLVGAGAADPSRWHSLALQAVSCTSAMSCEGVGQYVSNSNDQAMVAERWNGTTWAVQATPGPASAVGSELGAVQCTSARFCAAVGQYSVSVPTLTLAEVWNGTSWSIRPTASDPAADENELDMAEPQRQGARRRWPGHRSADRLLNSARISSCRRGDPSVEGR
jgi:hypothetical protein